MTKLGSRKLHICPKVTKMGSMIGHKINYNEAGALRGGSTIGLAGCGIGLFFVVILGMGTKNRSGMRKF